MNQGFHDNDYSQYAAAWQLDRSVTFLNHGAFGACPTVVLKRQAELRQQLEAEPIRFFLREMPDLLDASRRALAELIGSSSRDLVFTSNATSSVNAVLRSLKFEPGDEILLTDHGYNACHNVARQVAKQSGAVIVVARIPLPVQAPEQITEAILAQATSRTRLALIDHVTSPTAIVFPIQRIVAQLEQRGIDTLVDGAHAPGMLAVDVQQIGAAYYAGNCHKWLCAPKGAAFLHVRADRQVDIMPPVISHGYNHPRTGYSRFQDLFDWPGTTDPSPWLCMRETISFLQSLSRDLSHSVPKEPHEEAEDNFRLEGLRRHNHELVVAASRSIREQLDLQPSCPTSMTGSISAILLPRDCSAIENPDSICSGSSQTSCSQQFAERSSVEHDSLDETNVTSVHRFYDELLEQFSLEVPVQYLNSTGHVILRISAQAYNSLNQYQKLIAAMKKLLERT